MKNRYQQTREPSQGEIQGLLNLYNAGQLAQAELAAKSLIKSYPGTMLAYNVLGVALEGQRKFEEAAVWYRKALSLNPGLAELHFNLGVVLSNLGKLDDAITSYKRAAALKPNLAVVHFNLGTALQERGRLEEAAASFHKALTVEPNFFEAHGNLGTVLQKQGKLEEAEASYRRALAIHADARGHFNLGTALRDQGRLDEAIASYQQALAFKPDYVEAHNNMGEALRDQGRMEEAVACFRTALAIDPENGLANFNWAQFLFDAGKLDQAIAFFEKSQLHDWRERTLYCLYKTEKFDEFRSQLQAVMLNGKHTSPFLATLSTHYATNFGTPDPYNFCPNAMEFVYQNSIPSLAGENSALLQELLRDINHAEIAERKQGRLHNGIQSAGNLFKRPEESFRKLAELVKNEVENYRKRFAGAQCELIKSFPQDMAFTSSWYVKMRRGGHLTSHIHEEGWISGAVYLAMPKETDGTAGSFSFGTDGDDYPRKRDDFAVRSILPNVGDIILFPSSLFHRTIPFDSNEDRICVAFDIKPKETPKLHLGLKLLLLGWLEIICLELAEVAVVPMVLLA
ncbi:MAG TPA: tetratricopeptide repeat protein [Methylophilaceae bacterium]|nr:tetratricopeptide repeat protein [Methylophilaceae bacterium]